MKPVPFPLYTNVLRENAQRNIKSWEKSIAERLKEIEEAEARIRDIKENADVIPLPGSAYEMDGEECEELLEYFSSRLSAEKYDKSASRIVSALGNAGYIARLYDMDAPPGHTEEEVVHKLASRKVRVGKCRLCGTDVSVYSLWYQNSRLCGPDCGIDFTP